MYSGFYLDLKFSFNTQTGKKCLFIHSLKFIGILLLHSSHVV